MSPVQWLSMKICASIICLDCLYRNWYSHAVLYPSLRLTAQADTLGFVSQTLPHQWVELLL